jgi:hypothetical protein
MRGCGERNFEKREVSEKCIGSICRSTSFARRQNLLRRRSENRKTRRKTLICPCGSPTRMILRICNLVRSRHDSKIKIRTIQIVFPEKEPEDREAAQSWNFRHAAIRRSSRARRAIFQAPRMILKKKFFLKLSAEQCGSGLISNQKVFHRKIRQEKPQSARRKNRN